MARDGTPAAVPGREDGLRFTTGQHPLTVAAIADVHVQTTVQRPDPAAVPPRDLAAEMAELKEARERQLVAGLPPRGLDRRIVVNGPGRGAESIVEALLASLGARVPGLLVLDDLAHVVAEGSVLVLDEPRLARLVGYWFDVVTWSSDSSLTRLSELPRHLAAPVLARLREGLAEGLPGHRGALPPAGAITRGRELDGTQRPPDRSGLPFGRWPTEVTEATAPDWKGWAAGDLPGLVEDMVPGEPSRRDEFLDGAMTGMRAR